MGDSVTEAVGAESAQVGAVAVEPAVASLAAAPAPTPKAGKKKLRGDWDGSWRPVFLAAVRTIPFLIEGCRTAGVSRRLVKKWLKTDEKFRQDFEEAQEEGFETLEVVMFKRGKGVKLTPEEEQLAGKVDTLSGIFMLKNWRPDRYRDRVEHAGPAGGPIQMVFGCERPPWAPDPNQTAGKAVKPAVVVEAQVVEPERPALPARKPDDVLGKSGNRRQERAIVEFLKTSKEPIREKQIWAGADPEKAGKGASTVVWALALRRLVRAGVVERIGAGKQGEPFLYQVFKRSEETT